MLLDEIKLGESENVEFKSELPGKSEKYIKTIVAFANTSGGKLIIGVKDGTREIIGVQLEEIPTLIDKITNVISDMVTPQLIPAITSAQIEDKNIVIIEIFPGATRPYYISSLGQENGTFVRANATTRLADAIMLKELQLQGRNQSYDETILPEKDLDPKAVKNLCDDMQKHIVTALRERGESPVEKEITITNLENWAIVKRVEDKLYPTVAFDLLTENTQRFAKIQCGLFKGTDRVVFLDKREYAGPIYEQIEEAYRFVLKHINLGAEINGLYRKETYELPPSAIREAIANAVTHRNYMERACIQVCVYDDRVEITSPGMLYGDLTIDMIKRGRTRIRNAAIAEAFGRMYVIEGWGTGIRRMIDACKEYGVQEPVFTEVGTDFRVEFFRKTLSVRTDRTDNRTENLTQKQEQIIALIRDNPEISTTAMAKALSCSRSTVSEAIKELKNKKIVERVGSDRKGYWKILN